jgi:hypothetical protein
MLYAPFHLYSHLSNHIAPILDDNPAAATWSAVECNVAIICACLPSTRNLISRLIPRIFSTRSNGYRSKVTNGYSYPITPTQNKFQTSVAADTLDLDMKELTQPSKTSESEERSASRASPGEIKVTTIVSQEFGHDAPDEESSVRRLVDI